MNKLYILLLSACAMAAPVQAQDTMNLPGGLRCVIHKKGKGDAAIPGSMVKVKYAGRLTDGTPFDNGTIPFQLGVGQVIQGWDEGIAVLNTGDSATLLIPSAMGYGSMGAGSIPPNADLIFDVVLLEVMKPIDHQPFDGKGLDTLKTPSGLRYIIIRKPGDTARLKDGQQVAIHYAGYLTDGSKFDASYDRSQPLEFQVGRIGLIKGWLEMLSLAGNGGKYKAIIPSNLAYGERGYPGVIPPNATLVFDMEVVSVNGVKGEGSFVPDTPKADVQPAPAAASDEPASNGKKKKNKKG
jgi:FKBP-type peptidyl-prolyl cis-trans isomerase